MDKDFKFGGSRIKRKAVALILLGAPAAIPLFLMAPAFFTLNFNTVAVSVDDTLGTGAALLLFLCLLVSPMVTLTGQRWFFGLRRWYGIMMAFCGLGDMFAMVIRPNRTLPNAASHTSKAERAKATWPEVVVESWDESTP